MISDDLRDGLDSALRAVEDADLRAAVIETFETARERAQAGEIDVVVLAARRLACVYQLLVDAGLPPLSDVCAVVSDRYLDLPGDWSWRSVLIIDDSVVVGTTLLRLYDRISERVAGQGVVASMSACLDEQQYAQYLIDAVGLTTMRSRPSRAVEDFSRQLVEALFAGGIPFFSDYPTTTPIPLGPRTWDDYLHNDGWQVADVTAPLLVTSRRRTFSHVPTDATIDQILGRMPTSVAGLVEGLKVRSYFTQPDDNEDIAVRFVPIAMLSPSTPDEVDAALEAALAAINGDRAFTAPQWPEWDDLAKHRFVQMYVATCLLDEALSFTRKSSHQLDWQLETLQIDLYFGASAGLVEALREAIVADVRSKTNYDKTRPPQTRLNVPRPSWILNNPLVRQMLWGNRELLSQRDVIPPEPAAGQVSRVGLVFGHAVASVFGYVNGVLELEQRRVIRDLGDIATYRKRFPPNNIRRVLSQGLTLRELTIALLPDTLGGTSWQQALISLAVDVGNDLGIIVPVTRYDDVRGVIYRCYRLGETARLASTPLPVALCTGEWDRFSHAAVDGYPILSELVDVKHAVNAVDPEENSFPQDAMATLGDTVRAAVPGDIVEQLDGEVIDRRENDFVAQFDDPAGGGGRIVTIPLTQLTPEESKRLVPGALVTWTLFDVGDERKDRQARVRLRLEPAWDTERLARDATVLSALVQTS